MRNYLCDLLQCEVPIVLAGMGGVARAELVAAVSEAGAFGFLGMVREPASTIISEIAAVRGKTSKPFGVNLIPAATDKSLLETELTACVTAKVSAVTLFWDLAPDIVRWLREAGVIVVCQVGSAEEAEAAQRAGAQVLVAQGIEAGGHVRGRTPIRSLLPEVLALANCPVLAAGGMTDGADLVWALRAGAAGIMAGTALMATEESYAHDYHKERLVDALDEDTILTDAFHINWPSGAFVRVLNNSVTRGERGDPFGGSLRKVIGEEEGRRIYLFSTDSPSRAMTGDLEAMALYAGRGVGSIKTIPNAKDRISAITTQACALLEQYEFDGPRPRVELASPVCYADEASATYNGMAEREEIIFALEELLKVKRASARVALHTLNVMDVTGHFEKLHRAEAHCCAVIVSWLRKLDAEPSTDVSEFYEKAVAIQDLRARQNFLKNVDDWVVRYLDRLIRRVQDERLFVDLVSMRTALLA